MRYQMHKPRQHERATLIANLIIQVKDRQPVHFASSMYNVSRGGAAVFSEYYCPIGTLISMELMLPDEQTVMRRVILSGIVRRLGINSDGNTLGIEFIAGAGDHDWFTRYLDRQAEQHLVTPQQRGFTLAELCITMIIACLLLTMAAPMYSKAMEQARLDAAAGNIRTIWSAQRVYWLEYRAFAPDLVKLEEMDLLGSALAETQSNPSAVYVYTISDADSGSFTATATRNASGVWSGRIQIDEGGDISGVISGSGGTTLSPLE